MIATLSQSLVWDPVPGAADYRVRATKLDGTPISTIFVHSPVVNPIGDLLAGQPTGATYVVYVAAKDVAGAGNGTPGVEAQIQFILEGLSAPTGLSIV